MKKMNKPEVEAVRFRGGIDVIATSGPRATLTLSGFNDDAKGNGSIDFSDGTKTETYPAFKIGREIESWYSSINPGVAFGGSGVATKDGNSSGFDSLSSSDFSSTPVTWADGVFTYDPNYSVAGYNNYIWFVK